MRRYGFGFFAEASGGLILVVWKAFHTATEDLGSHTVKEAYFNCYCINVGVYKLKIFSKPNCKVYTKTIKN